MERAGMIELANLAPALAISVQAEHNARARADDQASVGAEGRCAEAVEVLARNSGAGRPLVGLRVVDGNGGRGVIAVVHAADRIDLAGVCGDSQCPAAKAG